VGQRTALINRIRGLLSELGIVLPRKAAMRLMEGLRLRVKTVDFDRQLCVAVP
jgi:transposase